MRFSRVLRLCLLLWCATVLAADPLLCALLNSAPNADMEMERFLTMARRIMLELTEDAFVAKSRFQLEVLPMVRELGVRVSIDDFGTGYSSLSVLADITADELKVDRSFITAIHQRPRSQSVLRTIESLAVDVTPVRAAWSVPATTIAALPGRLRARSHQQHRGAQSDILGISPRRDGRSRFCTAPRSTPIPGTSRSTSPDIRSMARPAFSTTTGTTCSVSTRSRRWPRSSRLTATTTAATLPIR